MRILFFFMINNNSENLIQQLIFSISGQIICLKTSTCVIQVPIREKVYTKQYKIFQKTLSYTAPYRHYFNNSTITAMLMAHITEQVHKTDDTRIDTKSVWTRIHHYSWHRTDRQGRAVYPGKSDLYAAT